MFPGVCGVFGSLGSSRDPAGSPGGGGSALLLLFLFPSLLPVCLPLPGGAESPRRKLIRLRERAVRIGTGFLIRIYLRTRQRLTCSPPPLRFTDLSFFWFRFDTQNLFRLRPQVLPPPGGVQISDMEVRPRGAEGPISVNVRYN